MIRAISAYMTALLAAVTTHNHVSPKSAKLSNTGQMSSSTGQSISAAVGTRELPSANSAANTPRNAAKPATVVVLSFTRTW